LAIATNIAGLPVPPPEAQAASTALTRAIAREIAANAGRVSFARYMELALYAPGLGYYMAGARKLGRDGDFVTAPEISPLFGRTLARQFAPLIADGLEELLEIGAGSGALAADLLLELERLGRLPRRYLILELSSDLRSRSRDTLAARAPQHLERVAWLAGLPPAFTGIVFGKRGARRDACAPRCSQPRRDAGRLRAVRPGRRQVSRSRSASHRSGAARGSRTAASRRPLQHGNSVACARVRSEPRRDAGAGVAFFFDYGFPEREFYHPQRARGTLMCHYRHRAHDDPYFLPGLQDITGHIDFSAIARVGRATGMDLLGYTNQAQFLLNCGLTSLLAETDPEDAASYAPLAAQAQKLVSPAEMGELFKVIAFGRNVAAPLRGFSSGDRRHTL
jgi:SAM-dependent MidA family methyltransferase